MSSLTESIDINLIINNLKHKVKDGQTMDSLGYGK